MVCSAVNRVRVQVTKRDKQRFCLLFASTSIDKERINTWTRTLDRSLMFFNVGTSSFVGNFTERGIDSIGGRKRDKRSICHAESFEEECCVSLSYCRAALSKQSCAVLKDPKPRHQDRLSFSVERGFYMKFSTSYWASSGVTLSS
jgi:hypothetical protein